MKSPLRIGIAALLLALALAAPTAAMASAPTPDPAFGHGGHAEPTYERNYEPAEFLGATVGADGSILATRHDSYNGRGVIGFDRYFADGSPDRSYRQENTEERPEAIDAKGRVVRTSQPAYESPRGLERLNPDGSPDAGFGCDAQDTSCHDVLIDSHIDAILPLASGKIVVAGSGTGPRVDGEPTLEVTVARYDESGVLDPTFGSGGVVHLGKDAGVKGEELAGLTVGPGEDVLLTLDDEARTEQEPGPRGGSKVVAVGPDGHLDQGYGTGGTFTSDDYVGAVEGEAGGALLLTGERWGASLGRYLPRDSDIYLTRLTAAGAPDPAFGAAGGTTTVDLGGIDSAATLLRRPDGSIVVGGAGVVPRFDCLIRYSFSFFCVETPAVVGFTPGGALDPEFGAGGIARLQPLTFEHAVALPVGVLFLRTLPGGAVLAGGGNAGSAFLAELTGTGNPVSGFGDAGIVTLAHRRKSAAAPRELATDPRGRIVALGLTDAGGIGVNVESPAVFRFDPDGSVDRSFAAGRGFVTVPGRDVGTIALAVDRRGRALVLDGKYSENAVIRVTAAGELDPAFGKEGFAPLPEYVWGIARGRRSKLAITPRSIVALPDGGVLVMGVSGGNLSSRIDLIRLAPRGALDRSFGRGGIVQIAPGPDGEQNARAMAVMADGRVVLAGSIRAGKHKRQTAMLVRLLPDGRPDPAFGKGGLVTMPVRGKGLFTALAVGPGGAITVGGRHIYKDRYTGLAARFSAAGLPDRSFIRRAARGPGEATSSPAQVLLWGKRIVMLPTYYPSVTIYSAGGRYERELVFGKTHRPTTYLGGGVLQDGGLVVASKTAGRRTFRLTRLLP
jgi:uncharacterized delta-60 repeat protein